MKIIRRVYRSLSDVKLALRLLACWMGLKKVSKRLSSQLCTRNRVLIVPCDPWSVVGSRGDQAMIIAAYQDAKSKYPNLPIEILADSHATDDVVRAMDMNSVVCWPPLLGDWFETCAANYKAVYILGADVTDGIYGWETAWNLLAMYDLFTRCGAKTRYLGFSFSRHPKWQIKWVMKFLKKNLPLPVRDPVSYERVKAFTLHRPIQLIADAAFCLQPTETPRIQEDVHWCENQKQQGQTVLAINIHPMFNDLGGNLEAWQKNFIQLLVTALQESAKLSLLFLPHDDRPRVSDIALLTQIYRALPPQYLNRIHLVETVYRADEIKALVGHCSALLAGRMHLSIAALGQGVPVFALVYQGKFEGLWQHFALSSKTLCEPCRILQEPASVQSDFQEFLAHLSALQTQIQSQLPTVLALSKSQFDQAL